MRTVTKNQPSHFLSELGPGPFPAVLDMFGTTGGLMEFRAALLATHGYTSYALPIFAYEALSESMLNIDFEYFEVNRKIPH